MQRLLYVSIFIFIITLGAVGYGYHRNTINNAYSKGQKVGYQKGNVDGFDAGMRFFQATSNNDLQTQYEALRQQYNELVAKVNLASSKKQNLHCTSTTYGVNNQFTSTNCY